MTFGPLFNRTASTEVNINQLSLVRGLIKFFTTISLNILPSCSMSLMPNSCHFVRGKTLKNECKIQLIWRWNCNHKAEFENAGQSPSLYFVHHFKTNSLNSRNLFKALMTVFVFSFWIHFQVRMNRLSCWRKPRWILPYHYNIPAQSAGWYCPWSDCNRQ